MSVGGVSAKGIVTWLCVYTAETYGNVLFNGFETDISDEDKKEKNVFNDTLYVPVNFSHFSPCSRWTVVNHSLRDETTGDLYCNDDKSTIRVKCAVIFAVSLVFETIGLVFNCINRIVKLVTFAHLWHPSKTGEYNFKGRITEASKDILRVALTPLILVGMLFATVFGAIISPYDGRKLFASLERFSYAGGYKRYHSATGAHDKFLTTLFAPCFQPEAVGHLFGGDLKKSDGQW